MRISDWSSDVCSSDLACALQRLRRAEFLAQGHQAGHFGFGDVDLAAAVIGQRDVADHIVFALDNGGGGHAVSPGSFDRIRVGSAGTHAPAGCAARSEEHTSELQSLMRISYAVFCLKKKKH